MMISNNFIHKQQNIKDKTVIKASLWCIYNQSLLSDLEVWSLCININVTDIVKLGMQSLYRCHEHWGIPLDWQWEEWEAMNHWWFFLPSSLFLTTFNYKSHLIIMILISKFFVFKLSLPWKCKNPLSLY